MLPDQFSLIWAYLTFQVDNGFLSCYYYANLNHSARPKRRATCPLPATQFGRRPSWRRQPSLMFAARTAGSWGSTARAGRKVMHAPVMGASSSSSSAAVSPPASTTMSAATVASRCSRVAPRHPPYSLIPWTPTPCPVSDRRPGLFCSFRSVFCYVQGVGTTPT
jgi:hypothetical protein